ncbi:hypothetical protein DIPPA_05215 [Diplonema papillatum]|nr:hypothetical protein DIPPA_05215 [Diplonema papillatum]
MSASHECCICFEPLPSDSVGVLMAKETRSRVCNHYFHYDCIKGMSPFITRGYGLEMEIENLSTGDLKCPMCRVSFNGICRMPDPDSDVRGWLRLVDVDQTGRLSKEEVKEVVKSTCFVSEEDLEEVLGDRWDEWDPDACGTIKLADAGGLLDYVHEKLGAAMRKGTSCPHIAEDKNGWFDFWDQSETGDLTKAEVVRALVKTFERADDEAQREQDVTAIVESVWPLFDQSGSNSISKSEFVATDGLADTIIAFLQQDPSFSNAAGATVRGSNASNPNGLLDASNAGTRGRRRQEGVNAWACPQCTYLNWQHKPCCSMCDVANPFMDPSLMQFFVRVRTARETNPSSTAAGRSTPRQSRSASYEGAANGRNSPIFSNSVRVRYPLTPRGEGSGWSNGLSRSAGSTHSLTRSFGSRPNLSSTTPHLAMTTPDRRTNVCVVCGNQNRPGENRKSGWKCRGCVGTPHRLSFN